MKKSCKKHSLKFGVAGEVPPMKGTPEYIEWLQKTKGVVTTNPEDDGNLVPPPADIVPITPPQKNIPSPKVDFSLFKKNPALIAQQQLNSSTGFSPYLTEVLPPSADAVNTPPQTNTGATTFEQIQVPEGQMAPEKNGMPAQKKPNTSFLRNTYIGLNLVGAGINNLQKNQAQQNEREYNGYMNRPISYVNIDQEGKNRNSQNLSVSDTALTRNGALLSNILSKKYAVGGKVPVEMEKNEAYTTPDGITTHLDDEPTHEKGGVNLDVDSGTKVYSDNPKMKPSQIVDVKKLSDLLGVRLKKNMTYAEAVKKVDKKYDVEKNTEILKSARYDTLFKQSAQAMINKANVLKDNVIFPIQQSHNGNSNGKTYKKGGIVDIDENEINRLKQLGYEFNTL